MRQNIQSLFATPNRTGVTMAAAAMLVYTINFVINCAKDNCNKTPEEINAHLHLWQQFVNATVNTTTNATTLVSTTALSTGQLSAENGLIAVTAASFAGALSVAAHKLGSLIGSLFCPPAEKANTEQAPLLRTEGTDTEGSVNIGATEKSESRDEAPEPGSVVPIIIPTNTN